MFLPFLPSGIGKNDQAETPTSITELAIRDLIDLRLTIIAMNRESLKVLGVKKICDNYKLYYHCKQNHFCMTAKSCLNKDTTL